MGACTVVVNEYTVFGNKAVTFGTIHASSSYATGGDSFTAAELGLNTVDALTVFPGFLAGVPNTALVPVADLATMTLLLFGAAAVAVSGAPLEEFGSTVDASGYVCPFIAYGTP